MDDDKLAFLGEGAPALEAQTQPDPEPQAAPEAAPAPEAPPSPSPLAEASGDKPASEDRVGHVPLSAMLDERERRQAAEKRLAELEAQRSPAPPPGRDDQIQAQLYTQRMEMSRGFADAKYGADAMAKVHDWAVARCDADPFFNAQVKQSKNPYEFVKQAYDHDQVVSAVKPDDLDDFRAWRAAKASAQPTPTPTPAPPPKSLANQPNAGGAGRPETPMGPGAAFASVLNR